MGARLCGWRRHASSGGVLGTKAYVIVDEIDRYL